MLNTSSSLLPSRGQVPGLPLRLDVKLTAVAADLVFYQAKHCQASQPIGLACN